MRLLLFVAIALATPITARADSYRDQIIISDAVGATLTASSIVVGKNVPATTRIGLFAAGLITMTFAAPVVHGIHDHYGRLGISVAARMVGPIVGLRIGGAIGDCGDDCISGALLVGLFTGYLAAMVFDAAYLTPGDSDPTSARTMAITIPF